MRVRLLKKGVFGAGGYCATWTGGRVLFAGDEAEISELDAARVLTDFPGVFEQVDAPPEPKTEPAPSWPVEVKPEPVAEQSTGPVWPPAGLQPPARAGLAAAGLTTPEAVNAATDKAIVDLKGVGRAALRVLRAWAEGA